MTTIAYRDGVLAADEAESRGDDSYIIRCKKLHLMVCGRMKGAVMAETGDSDICKQIIVQLSRSPKHREPPENASSDSATVIVMHPDGSVEEYDSTLIPYPMESEFCAWGSGHHVAMGAMAHGASAVEAIKAAAKINPGTRLFGSAVPHMRVSKKWKKKKKE